MTTTRQDTAMSTVILKSHGAIHYAEVHRLSLHEYAHERHGARDTVTAQEARQFARDHPDFIWVEAPVPANSADPEDAFH